MNTHTRNIRSGDQYKKLIPLPHNRKVYLGEGDTFYSLDNMKTIILDTLSETKQLANKLKGNSVPESVANVKDFLYNHIQYLQDGEEQDLHSPSNTWANRATGVDCKSYSIFASSLLTNMGIINSLRQIKQANFNPEYWSHVYVVIPGTDLVVDGTVEYNHEPLFSEKSDKSILATGLAGLQQLAGQLAGNWCERSNNNSSTNKKNKGDARLSDQNLKDLIGGQSSEKSTNQVIKTGSEPLLQNSDRSRFLRMLKIKAKARLRILKLN